MAAAMSRLIVAGLLLWLVVVIMLSGTFMRTATPPVQDEQVIARLNRAIDELEELKRQNLHLRIAVESLGGPSASSFRSSPEAPPKDYEVYRRRAENDVQEIWFFARAQLDKVIKHSDAETKENLKKIRHGIYERQMSALVNMEKALERDGYDSWRKSESEGLTQIIQKRITKLQNPPDCQSAKKLICNLNKGCGYGCQLHHATYCLIMSYSMKRTLILKSKGWRYNPRGFETVFQPMSNNCLVESGGSSAPYPGNDGTVNVDLPIIDAIIGKPSQVPLAIPLDLAPRVTQIHGNPALWWISQILSILQRPQKDTSDFLSQVQSKFAIKSPYIGFHVRRTDKIGTEAAFHGIEEYMSWADEFFDKYEMSNGTLDARRVYIATDDPHVLESARKLYPDYKFFGDTAISTSASMRNRYTSESLRGVISDINMLAQSDFLVCTFSSQVCRVAFELMQLRFPDAAQRFRSLDDIFYFGGQKDHSVVAVLDHLKPGPGEFSFKKGDILGIAGNHWDGFSRGNNRRTRQSGLFPSFKATELVDAVDFGEF